jgi:hypothetical protein
MSDISYGQLVVISGINIDTDVILASQHAIAYATSDGMLATQPITGLSAETFSFKNDIVVGGDINMSSFGSAVNKVLILDSSKNITSSYITSTQLDYLVDVTSNIQLQLDNKIDVASNTLDFKTENVTRMIIDTSNVTIINSDASYSALDVSATSAIQFPVGTTAQRPNVGNGKIRYNSTLGEFEGYIQNYWKNLGGVIDVDKDTYISAETNPGTDNDEIKIYTGGVERIRVNANDTINIYTNLDISGNLDVSGNCIIKNDMQVDGKFTSDIKMRGQKFRIQR